MRPETAEALVVRTTAFFKCVPGTAASVGNAPNGIFRSAGLSARETFSIALNFDTQCKQLSLHQHSKAFAHEPEQVVLSTLRTWGGVKFLRLSM